ncbi:MAG: glycosyltransferase [Myxococcota bacterium]
MPRLSVVMIVRDEAEMVPGFLEAARGLWDELVVVDTGSKDDTVARFEAAGAKVVHFPWVDDFAAARNVSLEHATGDFVLVLDADERVDADFIEETRARLLEPGVGALLVRISNQLPYGHRRDSWVLRGWRHSPAVRFRHAIHEDPSESVSHLLATRGLTLARIEAPVEHLGYVRTRAAARDKKQRDSALLRACLAKDPSDFYSRLKLLELARYWQDEELWRTEARAATDQLEAEGRACLEGRPWAGELIALIAEGLFAPSSSAALLFLDGWAPRLPHSAAFFHRRGVFLEHQGHFARARADFEACLTTGEVTGDLQLLSVRPRLGLARLALEEGQPPRALEHARSALESGPRDPEALLAVASLTRHLEGAGALERWAEAHQAIVPSCPERDWAVGEAHFVAGDHRAAVHWFRSGAGVPPGGPCALRLSQALLATGQFQASEQLARQLVAEQPEAGLGVLLFDLADGRDTALELELTQESANTAMRQWVDALIASRQKSFVRKVRSRIGAVADLFPWLTGYLLKKSA